MILSRKSLQAVVTAAREAGQTIAMTGGFFDMVTPGHVYHLREARSKGDLLIVEMGGDADARRVKGSGRPALPSWARAEIVSELRCVTHVIVEESWGEKLWVFDVVRPDVYLRGPDYEDKPFPEFEMARVRGGEGELGKAPLVANTTQILRWKGLQA